MTNLVFQRLRKVESSTYVLLIIISISAFTHIWNPTGFPALFTDEDIYLRRAMQVLEGLGPQEPVNVNIHPYDHPYFGSLFLASIFKIIGYPESLGPVEGKPQSIEMLYSVPRVLMGILGVIDTFLIYKISEVRYNRKVAIISSILFAVMPLTWLTRRILLDSIMLPFILSSILFALYYTKKIKIRSSLRGEKLVTDQEAQNIGEPSIILIFISGIFLGLAIFTKVPAFCIIPLVVYLIFGSGNGTKTKYIKNLEIVGLWLIPVILIPLIWPLYSISIGEFTYWTSDLQWQQARGGDGIKSVVGIFMMDPVLLTLGFLGLVLASLRRDYFIFIWVVSFFAYVGLSGWVLKFHYIMLLPAFCVSSAVFIAWLSEIRIMARMKKSLSTTSDYSGVSEGNTINRNDTDNLRNKTKASFSTVRAYFISNPSTAILVSGIVIFGLVITSIMVTSSFNSTPFEVIAYMTKLLPSEKNMGDKEVTVVQHRNQRDLLWIPKYVFHEEYDYRLNDAKIKDWDVPIKTPRVFLLVERWLKGDIESESKKSGLLALKNLNNNSEAIKTFDEKRLINDFLPWPYDKNYLENRGLGKTTEVRANR